MKKIYYTIILAAVSTLSLHAQQRGTARQQFAPAQRYEKIKQARENMMMENLNVEEKNQDRFRQLYSDYQESQRQIKDRFQGDFDPDKLSDKEAQQKLDESFELGEKLLENRKNYAQKMQSVIKPQQVLKMFRTEGMMREKIMNRRSEGQNSAEGPAHVRPEGFRNGRK